MQVTHVNPYARLPRPYRSMHTVDSTVDAEGRAHWLLSERPPATGRAPKSNGHEPYDALVVTVGDGAPQETHLSAVAHPRGLLGALPDGGFVVAGARTRRTARPGEQVQVFDALGRASWTFDVGDAVEHLLVGADGDLWVGHFDENPAGIRRWSASGELLWESGDTVPGAGWIMDCYALNVGRHAVWACPYTEFPVLEIREGEPVRVRSNSVRGARALAVAGERIVFFGGYGHDADRLVVCGTTGSGVEPVESARVVRPDGGPLGRRHVVSRDARVYVLEEPYTEWYVLDAGGAVPAS
ncbi:hypothetical protein ACFVY9_10375 [Streptomyces sp. NPDC059544]|uniref:hypothetical protein n=1 Tax=Streptomyces sp. NPDC059544 TaxID=3346861 RepID=UPI0036A4DC17